MADLKTTNIYGDAYINNKVGINTNTPATRLQIGQLSPTTSTEGLQFGDDVNARLYRGGSGQVAAAGGLFATSYITAGSYLQTNNNNIYPSGPTSTLILNAGNSAGNGWISGLTLAQNGNVVIANDLTVNGNTYLGNANNDTVYVNDTIRIGATDSGDASLFFGEGGVAGSDYGARWYWDSGYTFTWYTRNAGTDTALFDYVTNDLNYINWRRHFHMQNKEINYNAQVHFNAGTRFVGNNTSYLIFRSDSTGAGGIQVQDGSATNKGYTGYWDSAGGGILNNTGNWAVRYNFGNANSGGTLYGDWTVNGNSTVTGITMTNLTGAYQNTTVYDSPRTQSATPSRGIRAPASSIQFTDSYAIAPSWTFRSTGDWPVPYGIGWGTGGESSGIFQRYHSNGSSFGDMIFYTGNDGLGAFSFRRHTWEGTTHFAAGSGELNTELFRIDWSGNLTMLGTLNGSANSATLYANNGSYGAWAINGTRNGWGGIEFANNGVSLMMGSDTVGFHQNTNGWLFRVHNGSGFIYKGAWGGGTAATIYDTTNGNGVLLRAAGGPGGYGDWNTFGNVTQTTNVITTEYFNLNGGSGNSNFPPVVSYTYGILANLGSGGDARAQVYISHAGNDLIFRGGWGTSSWQTWNRCLTNVNSPYAYNMDQYVRTTDTVTFSGINATGNLQIRNDAPTITFRDTNHRTGYIHVNSNIFYVLTGPNDSANGGWSIVANSRWPLEINLSNNNATFGGIVDAISFTGAGTGLTGTASSLTAGAVTNGFYTTGGQTIAGITYFSNGESINLYGIRGRFTNEYIHLYNKVGVGHPGGWGQGESSTPDKGLSTYGGLNIAYGDNAVSTFNGVLRVNSNIRQGADLARPLASWSVAGTSTGMVIFSFPGNTGNYGMVHCVFDIYEYNSNTVSTVIVGGHNWNGAWYNFGANVIGRCGKSVRLGTKDSKYCVVFGGAASSWEYGTIILRKIHNGGFYTGIMDMGGTFTTQQTTTESFSNISGDLRLLRTSADFIADGGVTGTSFTGAGTGLTGTASSLSIGGNAATATTLQTARAINGVSFNGSAAITVNGLNYNVNNDWLRENGDDDQFKLYGNSRTMIYRTDGNTNAHGGGAFAHIFYYGGSADANRMFIINTDGRLWSTYHGWLDTMSISGNAATATSADNIDGRPFVNTNSNSATNADSINSNGISYYTGGVTNFSGNATDGALYSQAYSNDWQHQIAGDYRSGQIALRGKNSGTWQSWRRVLDETNSPYALNMNQYVRTTDNVTFGTVTATLSGTATNAGAINSDTGNVGGSRLQYWQTSGNTALNPDGEWYNAIRMGHGDPVTYYSNTLAVRMTGGNLGDIYTRTTTNGVTGSWNRFWHNNNDGAGSGLDADLLDGLSMHTGRNNEANKVVRTDSNGYIQAGWINTPSGDMPDTESINKIYCSSDDYVRFKGVADFKQQIGLTYKNSTPRSTSTTDTNYWTGMMGWSTTDFNTMVTWGCGFIDSWGSPGNSPGAGYTHFVGIQSFHYTNGDTDGTDNYGYQLVAGAGTTSPLFLRVNWGSAGSWRTMLDSSNYNSYAPSLTGNGASGTWAINITGNAATATTATNVTIANGSVTLAKIENITAYTILGNSNASAAATPAALSVATVATMLSGQTMNINGSSTSCSGNAATATTATNATVNANNTSAAWYPVVWHSGNTLYSSAGVQIYANGNYLQATYLNSSDNVDTGNISHIVAKFGDNYHRSATAAKVAAFISGQTMNINGSSTSCSGTATTATTANALNTGNSYTISGLTNNGTINIFPTYAGGYSYFLRMGYDNSGNYDYTVKRNGTTGFLEFNGTQTNYVAYYFAVSGASGLGIGVSPSSRLHVNGDGTNPAIRVDNGAIVTGVASNSKTFYGFMPISIAGTTKYIQLWN